MAVLREPCGLERRSMKDQRISGGRPMKEGKNVIVITGASSGFGALAARALARAGHTAYASMRETTGRNAPQVAEAQTYAADHGVDLRTIELDVASEASAAAAIEQIVAAHGRLDVVIHNAGHMVFGPAEACAPAAARELPSRVPARLGRQNLLQPDAAGRAPGRERRRAAGRAARRRSRAGAAQADARQARQPV